MTTHYDTLGVTPDAPPEVISAAYRALSKQLHPDRPGGDAEAFALVNAANDGLRHPDLRAAYDASLTQAALPETEADADLDETSWGEEVELEEVIVATVVPIATPTAYETPPETLRWMVTTPAGWVCLLAPLVGVLLFIVAINVTGGDASAHGPRVPYGDQAAFFALGSAILVTFFGVHLGWRVGLGGFAAFAGVLLLWFLAQDGGHPDGRWIISAFCVGATLALTATSSILFRTRP